MQMKYLNLFLVPSKCMQQLSGQLYLFFIFIISYKRNPFATFGFEATPFASKLNKPGPAKGKPVIFNLECTLGGNNKSKYIDILLGIIFFLFLNQSYIMDV